MTIDDGYIYDLIDRIKDGQYDDPPRPLAPNKQYLKQDHNAIEARIYSERLAKHEIYRIEYAKSMREYTQRKRMLFLTFKADALKYCDITDHPKAERAFEMAWEECRDSFVQVVEYLGELSELMLTSI
jgi:hypothetical protein